MIIQKIRNSSGFTLIELLVCIAIVAILAAILVPVVVGVFTSDTDTTGQVEIIDQSDEEKPSQPQETGGNKL